MIAHQHWFQLCFLSIIFPKFINPIKLIDAPTRWIVLNVWRRILSYKVCFVWKSMNWSSHTSFCLSVWYCILKRNGSFVWSINFRFMLQQSFKFNYFSNFVKLHKMRQNMKSSGNNVLWNFNENRLFWELALSAQTKN